MDVNISLAIGPIRSDEAIAALFVKLHDDTALGRPTDFGRSALCHTAIPPV
jgi:hypothetical protein